MMEIRLYDRKLFLDERFEQTELLATTDQPFDFGGLVVINNQAYTMCWFAPLKNILGVYPTELNEEPEEKEYGDFECPYCGSIDDGAFELEDRGETQCGNCNSELSFERHVTVEYTVKPVKLAPIMRIETGDNDG